MRGLSITAEFTTPHQQLEVLETENDGGLCFFLRKALVLFCLLWGFRFPRGDEAHPASVT